MSIYASGADIGFDWFHDKATGRVLTYRGSHVYPTPGDPPAAIYLGSIVGHCVPGASEDLEWNATVGEYLRLDVAPTNPKQSEATVVLTEDGAKELRRELTRWLKRVKTRPATEPEIRGER